MFLRYKVSTAQIRYLRSAVDMSERPANDLTPLTVAMLRVLRSMLLKHVGRRVMQIGLVSTVLKLYCPGIGTLTMVTTPSSHSNGGSKKNPTALYKMTPLACSGFEAKLGAFLSAYPFGSLLMRNDSGDLRRSATQKVRSPVHPKHVSWAVMFTMNHAAESAASSRDSQASTAPDTSMSIRTHASARRALEEARKAVRKKRQQAKNRRASDVATITSRNRDANTTAVVPGTQSGLDEGALTCEGNHASKGRSPRTYDGERSRVRGRRQWPKEIGRGGRGVMRGRILPDFTEIDTSGPREENNANSSGEAVELPDKDDASAQALVAAIRATLASTAAQVEERKSRAATAAAEEGDGVYDLTEDEFAPKVRGA